MIEKFFMFCMKDPQNATLLLMAFAMFYSTAKQPMNLIFQRFSDKYLGGGKTATQTTIPTHETVVEVEEQAAYYNVSLSCNFVDTIFLSDPKEFVTDIGHLVDTQRKKKQRVTFNFVDTKQINRSFVAAWQQITAKILSENSVAVQMVFPSDPTSSLIQYLYDDIKKDIEMSQKFTIRLRRDDRRFT